MKKCSGLNQERNLLRLQDKTDLNKYVAGFWCGEGPFHWRKRYELWTHILVKNILMLDLFQLLSSPDVNWWTGVLWCFYQTLILTAPIHCRASVAETLMQRHKSGEETNSSTSRMTWGWGRFQHTAISGWTINYNRSLTGGILHVWAKVR